MLKKIPFCGKHWFQLCNLVTGILINFSWKLWGWYSRKREIWLLILLPARGHVFCVYIIEINYKEFQDCLTCLHLLQEFRLLFYNCCYKYTFTESWLALDWSCSCDCWTTKFSFPLLAILSVLLKLNLVTCYVMWTRSSIFKIIIFMHSSSSWSLH